MRTEIKEVQGIDWYDGAVMNCVWKGPRLKDVILTAGVKDVLRVRHDSPEASGDSATEYEDVQETWKGNVVCACYESPCQDSPDYGGSITLERAMLDSGDCILALEVRLQQNFSTLNRTHPNASNTR
jgi:sulfite oxidase